MSRGSRCSSAARTARSEGSNRILSSPNCRCSTAIWWRRARISVSLAWSLIGSSRSIASAFVIPRYASRSSTTSHRHPLTLSDLTGPDTSTGTRSCRVGQPVATRADEIVGTRNAIEQARQLHVEHLMNDDALRQLAKDVSRSGGVVVTQNGPREWFGSLTNPQFAGSVGFNIGRKTKPKKAEFVLHILRRQLEEMLFDAA